MVGIDHNCSDLTESETMKLFKYMFKFLVIVTVFTFFGCIYRINEEEQTKRMEIEMRAHK